MPPVCLNPLSCSYRSELAQYHQVQQKSLQGDTWCVADLGLERGAGVWRPHTRGHPEHSKQHVQRSRAP